MAKTEKQLVKEVSGVIQDVFGQGFQAGNAEGSVAMRLLRLETNIEKLLETAGGLDYTALTDDGLLRLASSRGFGGDEVRGLAVDELVKRHGQAGATKIIRRFATGKEAE